jgi:hypothetical protein
VGPAGGENQTEEENEVNRKRRRLTILLAAVGAIGAIAAISTAASLALFYDPTSSAPVTFATGNVALNSVTQSCSFAGLSPGWSNAGDPYGDNTGKACTLAFDYQGTLNAYLALDVAVTSTPETGANSEADCNGGNASGPQACSGLYNPSIGTPNNADDGIQVYVVGSGSTAGAPDQAFGIGNDQTIWETTGSELAPASVDYVETFNVYVYWPLDTASSDTANQNMYTGGTASVTLTEHSVQAADNQLVDCDAISDSQPRYQDYYYYDADQPTEGWGAGFSSGATGPGATYPGLGACPTYDTQNGTDWTSSTYGSELVPLYHPTT